MTLSTASTPPYFNDYNAEIFFIPDLSNNILYHRYITFNEKKLKGYPKGFSKEDFDRFSLKAWSTVPISRTENLDLKLFLLRDRNRIEDFTVQYRIILDQKFVMNSNVKIKIPLKNGYAQKDIHTMLIRTDYGHKQEYKRKHTNIDFFDINGNEVSRSDDENSFIIQQFEIPNYERAIHYVFMQVEKHNPLIGPQYWISPFGIHEKRVEILFHLWKESKLLIPLCILSRNINIRMIQTTRREDLQITDDRFKDIVNEEISICKKVELKNSDDIRLLQLDPCPDVSFLPFPFFIPTENALHGSFKFTKEGKREVDDRFKDMWLFFEKNNYGDETTHA